MTAVQKSLFFLLVTGLVACTTTKPLQQPNALKPHIEAVQQQYAPDSRTVLFAVQARENILSGETISADAKAALLQRLQQAGLPFTDSIQVLPQPQLQGQHHAVVTISVANLRSQPRHPAELSTQATLGTPLRVWKKEKGWYYVQTPDNYLAWVDAGGITLMNDSSFAAWQQTKKLIYTQPYGLAYTGIAPQGATVSDLVYGDVMQLIAEEQGYYKVAFPDGRTAFVPKAEAQFYSEWARSHQPTETNLVQTAQRLMGLPYLWGGTSFKGVDCSGFTKTVFFMNGLVLPRDASQQVQLGELVDTKESWHHLRPGDLLFFGVPARDGKPERVVHVGMWIGGNQEFIHSAGRVHISSFNPNAPNYDDSEKNRFLRAKRISPQATLFDLRTTSIF